MAADSNILREYLIALGFRVSEADSKKFDDKLVNWDKRATMLSRALVGAGVAAAGMVAAFAYQMDKLYFASKRTDAAVGSIQALEYAGKKVGTGGDAMRNALEGMARSLRSNPGLYGLLQSLGVQVEGRDKADVLTDLVTQLNKMPTYVANQFANLFGIDPDDLYMIRLAGDEFKKAQQARKELAAQLGVDMEANAKAGHEMKQAWVDVLEVFGLFKDSLITMNLDSIKELAGWIKEILGDWTKLVMMGDLKKRIMEGITGQTGGGVELSEESRRRLGQSETDKDFYEGTNLGTGEKYRIRKNWLDRQLDKLAEWGGAKKGKRSGVSQDVADTMGDNKVVYNRTDAEITAEMRRRMGYPEASGNQNSPQTRALFERLEKQYGLTPGTLDRIWKAESNRGDPKYMLSSAGAKGHFGFMDGTAKDMGLKDPNNLEQSAAAAAKYFAMQKNKYGGNDKLAAAAYNWGPGNLDNFGIGAAPKETRDYMDKFPTAPNIQQENHITVQGVSDPQRAADHVQEGLRSSNSELIRNNTPRVN